ncbi:MAG: hypothetical protein ACFE0J_22605 [Elainellaceae cyanobacterium]
MINNIRINIDTDVNVKGLLTNGRFNTRKEKTYGDRQRDNAKREAFLAALGDPKAVHLVYVDESGMDKRDDYGYGYAPVGERFYDLKSGRRQVLRCPKYPSPMTQQLLSLAYLAPRETQVASTKTSCSVDTAAHA